MATRSWNYNSVENLKKENILDYGSGSKIITRLLFITGEGSLGFGGFFLDLFKLIL